MHSKESAAKTLIVFPDVGAGNPAEAMAIAKLLERAGEPVDTWTPELASLFARVFHKRVSRSVCLTEKYTENSEEQRAKALLLYGLLTAAEGALSQEPNEVYDYGIYVQEHALGARDNKYLAAHFRRDAFIFIPDVYPKESAITIMRQTGITPVVWNEPARDRLLERGIEAKLVKPHILAGFANGSFASGVTERIVIKSSGSGMPREYTERLLRVLERIGVEYALYLPDKCITNEGTSPLPQSTKERNDHYYRDLARRPPKVLITQPTEMIQVKADPNAWRMAHLSLPARGHHEAENLLFAQEEGLTQGTIDPVRDSMGGMVWAIRQALVRSTPEPNKDCIGWNAPDLVSLFRDRG